jgi:hypothetical protein
MKNGRYPFMITLMRNGKPEIKGMDPMDAPEKLALEVSAQALNIAGDQAFMKATEVGKKASTPFFFINLMFVAASASIAGAGVGIKAGAARASAQAKYGFKAHDSYVLKQEVTTFDAAAGAPPREAVRNETMVSQLLFDVQQLKPTVKQDFEQLVSQFQEIVRRINHPYVLRKLSTKTYIASGLSLLAKASKSYAGELVLQAMSVLMSAVTNPLLKTMPETAEWSRALSDMLKDRLFKSRDGSLELPAMNGEYVWLPVEFPTPDEGGISFEVKASNDVFVCFAQEQFTSRNITTPLYEILLGGWGNTRHEIHIKNLGRPGAAIYRKQNPQAMLSSQGFTRYIITLNNGRIKLFKDSTKNKPLLEWQDPFPWVGIRSIGLSSWDMPITIRGIKLLVKRGQRPKVALPQKPKQQKPQPFKEGVTYDESTRDWQKDMQYRQDRERMYRPDPSMVSMMGAGGMTALTPPGGSAPLPQSSTKVPTKK